MNSSSRHIAYFSMEIALEPGIPTYSGGLGMLAGDTLRAAAAMSSSSVSVVTNALRLRKLQFIKHKDVRRWP